MTTTLEETLKIEKPTQKIYKDRAIWVGTLIGGPLVAGYLIAANFKAFNEKGKANKTWIFTIISTIIIFGGIFMIPENVKIPNQLFPLLYTLIAYFLVKHFQGQHIAAHISSGGQLYSWGRTIVVGIIGLAITVVTVLGIALLFEINSNNSITTRTYGIMKNEIAFDNTNLSEIEVDLIADALKRTAFFDETMTKYVYAKKVNNTYEISISIVDGIENDSMTIQAFVKFRTELQSMFTKNKIVLKLVAENSDKIVKTIE